MKVPNFLAVVLLVVVVFHLLIVGEFLLIVGEFQLLAHCGACHTPRNFFGAEREELHMSGGECLDGVRTGAHRPWSAPNLTSCKARSWLVDATGD